MNFTLLLRKFPVSHGHKSTSVVLTHINIYTKNFFEMKFNKSNSTTSYNSTSDNLDINKTPIKQKQKNEEFEKARFLVTRNILNYIRTSGYFNNSIANPTVLLNTTASIPSGKDKFKLSELLLADNDIDHNGDKISSYVYKILTSSASDNDDKKSLLNSAMIDCDNELVHRALVLDFTTCLRLLDIWMLYLGDSEFHRVAYLKCFIPLLKSSFDQIIRQDQENVKVKYPLIHLSFIGSLGKKSPETACLLNQVLKFCSKYPHSTFKTWSGFETAIMCNSFYRCGIQVHDDGILNQCVNILVEMCKNLQHFDVSVLITILKVFRQADYFNESLPGVLKELLLTSSMDSAQLRKSLRNLSVISHLSATFLRWRKSTIIIEKPNEYYKEPFEQLEKYMCEIITEANANPNLGLVRKRIKDLSRWLWAVANLGLEIDSGVTLPLILKAFQIDDIYYDPVSAIEMFLALVMMGHSIEPYLNMIIPQDRFAVALRYNTQSRQKERFGLLLYSLKVEHGDILGKFPPRNITRFEKIVGPPNIGGINWSEAIYPTRNISSGNDQSSHSELINRTMRFLKSKFKDFQVLRGFAVPYLHIPGLKLESERCTIFIEVIDDSFSYGLFQFKIRILKKMGCNTCLITQDEINKADFKELFKNITTIVNDKNKDCN